MAQKWTEREMRASSLLCAEMKTILLFVGVALAAVAVQTACAQGYPNKPVRFIIPFPPGGSSDVISRLIAVKLTERFGQQVIVDSRAGASGNIGNGVVARAVGDGYTIGLSGKNVLTVNPHLFKHLPFDPLADFSPISLVVTAAQVLVVHPSVPVSTVRELIALAKSRPGQLNYGSGGIGTISHINSEMLKTMAGVDIVHIPYKGAALVVADLMAGQIHTGIIDLAPAIPQIKAGRLRVLAITDDRRVLALPEVPTMIEAGLPGYIARLWWAVMAPKGTPADVVSRLNGELARIAKLPDVLERYQGLGLSAAHSTPQQVTDLIKTDAQQMGKILKAAEVVPE